jgi:hypothetical protein
MPPCEPGEKLLKACVDAHRRAQIFLVWRRVLNSSAFVLGKSVAAASARRRTALEVRRTKELIAEGDARAIRIQADERRIFVEIPLTPAATGGGVITLAAPACGAGGRRRALVARVKVESASSTEQMVLGDSVFIAVHAFQVA